MGASKVFASQSQQKLAIDSPFLINNSEQVTVWLQCTELHSYGVFSLDIQDLYYSIPQDALRCAVQEYIENNGVEEWPTVTACFEGKTLVQRSIVCIDCCVAPSLLSGIHLASVDSKIQASLDKPVFLKIVCYVDDYFLF